MDNIVDSLNKAYEKFVLASANVLESKESAGLQKASLTDAALENFKEKWELFRVACDQAEEFVESVKQRIGSECLVDEATGSTATTPAATGAATSLPPISAVRLEQMSRAVRWLVLELQRGSGGATGLFILPLLHLILDSPRTRLNSLPTHTHTFITSNQIRRVA